jgi:1-aminocyclopropane-1-carboxylate deaminase
MEIMNEVKDDYNFICCPCGTGTTIAGIILSLKKNQTAIGFSALKGGFMKSNVEQLLEDYSGRQIDANWMINENYHFGGYAKWNNELVTFIRKFRLDNKIPLDIVYTGKMFFGICDMIKNDYFPKGSKILVVHTGGLQGNKGFTEKTGIEI